MVGTDMFEFESRTYLATVDYYSGFFELDYLSSTKSASVITKLKSQFARHGIPDKLISDNGPQFQVPSLRILREHGVLSTRQAHPTTHNLMEWQKELFRQQKAFCGRQI